MKFEDVLAIFLGIIFGCFLGFTKFDLPLGEAYKDLPLPMQIMPSASSVNDQTSKVKHSTEPDYVEAMKNWLEQTLHKKLLQASDLMNATEIIERHLSNCNELYLYSVKPLEWFFGKLGSKE
jgi:hypothetical protein